MRSFHSKNEHIFGLRVKILAISSRDIFFLLFSGWDANHFWSRNLPWRLKRIINWILKEKWSLVLLNWVRTWGVCLTILLRTTRGKSKWLISPLGEILCCQSSNDSFPSAESNGSKNKSIFDKETDFPSFGTKISF